MSVCKKKKFPKVIYTRMNFDSVFFIFLLFGNCKWKCVFYRNHTSRESIRIFISWIGYPKKSIFFEYSNRANTKIGCFFLLFAFNRNVWVRNIYRKHTHTQTTRITRPFFSHSLSLLLLLNFGKLKCVRDLDAPTKNHHSYRHHNNHHHQQSIHPSIQPPPPSWNKSNGIDRSIFLFENIVARCCCCCCLDHIILFCIW